MILSNVINSEPVNMEEFYADWVNIVWRSKEYKALCSDYIEVFDEAIPLSYLPKTITMEELAKEVNEAIRTGISLEVKYPPPEDEEESGLDPNLFHG